MTSSAPLFIVSGVPIRPQDALLAALAALALLLLITLVALIRSGKARQRERDIADERQEAIEARFSALAQAGSELHGRIGAMAEQLGARQSDLARIVSDRLDSVQARLGAGLENRAQSTGENLGKPHEPFAVSYAAGRELLPSPPRRCAGLGARQGDLARFVSDRLDSGQARLRHPFSRRSA